MTLYALQVRNGRHYDTHIFREKACHDLVAKWPWFCSNRPVRRKWVVLNCARYELAHVEKATP